jgi:hypothetical protein
MFSVLVTNPHGASEAVQSAYLIERRLDLAATTEPVLQARQRSTGLRHWLKCPDGSPESAVRLETELALLARLSHPYVLSPLDLRPSGSELYLMYKWQAEQPLTTEILHGLSAAAGCRLASMLTAAVHWLHGQPAAIAHHCLELENLWLDSAASWMRLSGFNRAQAGARPAELLMEREECWRLAIRLASLDGRCDSGGPELAQAAQEWIGNPQAGAPQLRRELQQLFLSRVTADL